jgi:hypothetical protein
MAYVHVAAVNHTTENLQTSSQPVKNMQQAPHPIRSPNCPKPDFPNIPATTIIDPLQSLGCWLSEARGILTHHRNNGDKLTPTTDRHLTTAHTTPQLTQLTMRHPAQRLHFCSSTNTLLVALGGTLQCFSGTTGALMTSWSAPQLAVRTTKKEKRAQEEQEKKAQEEGEEKKAREEEWKKDEEGKKESSPSKKRKVNTAEEEPAWVRTSMLGVGAPRGDGEGTGNSITRMLAVQGGKYLVVVTNEDKTLRVFEIAAGGAELKVLSERYAHI